MPNARRKKRQPKTEDEKKKEDEIKRQAEEIKKQANEQFRKQNYKKAIDLYTEAIKINPNNAIYYSNRSMCRMKIESYGLAFTDADKAIKIDPCYAKGYYQKGVAQYTLGKYKDAKKLFTEVLRISPQNKDAQKKIKECEKAIKADRFQKALENKKVWYKLVHLESMPVEKDYKGPRIEDVGITKKFVEDLIAHYKDQKKLHKRYVYQILLSVIEYYKNEPNIIDLSIPEGEHMTVCGDVYGHFFDILNLWKLNGMPSEENPYLFMGNYVNHGSYSLEVLMVFFSLKLLYPNHFHLLRGNHECKLQSDLHGFRTEVTNKVDRKESYEVFQETFNIMPICSVINKKVFVVHGGLGSDDDTTLHQINSLKRNRQPDTNNLLCELLWSEPRSENGRGKSSQVKGISFGPDVTETFFKTNNLELMIRSNALKMSGHESHHDGKCLTVFTAPNFKFRCNRGAYLRLDDNLKPEFTSFNPVPAPKPKMVAFGSNAYLI